MRHRLKIMTLNVRSCSCKKKLIANCVGGEVVNVVVVSETNLARNLVKTAPLANFALTNHSGRLDRNTLGGGGGGRSLSSCATTYHVFGVTILSQ